ncbi:28S ribosomal protein S15, mitochondrial-like [Asterias rubens]|uniref:28S ribosomal protein S15, mitochondrial-like n=1 Tax=Asterias rubens TaxID=7604 RepID=UPI001455748B|nr:28S ribosomal protein S15, mitochondrial-like [Asterias rubens]
MFRRLTTEGCGLSRQICRNLSTTPAVCGNVALNSCAATNGASCRLFRRQDELFDQPWDQHRQFIPHTMVRTYASKAASKFSRRVKKETFDRYMGMEPSRLQSGFEEIKELEDASEDVKRIFSLEFAPRREIKKLQEVNTLQDIDHDPTDESHANLLFTSIAKCTVTIRNLAPHVQQFPRDKGNKRIMLMMIDRRRKNIKHLRKINFELSERLLEKLGITYSPPPKYLIRKKTKRYLEKKALCEQAFLERKEALQEFTFHLREEQLKDIAILKKDLGIELTEEEMGRLQEEST